MTIGQNIRRLRENAGLSQNDLAKRIGKTRSIISQYEADICAPRMGAVEDLARAFGVKKSEIIEDRHEYAVNHYSDLTTEECRLIELFRLMDNRGRRDVLRIVASLSPSVSCGFDEMERST